MNKTLQLLRIAGMLLADNRIISPEVAKKMFLQYKKEHPGTEFINEYQLAESQGYVIQDIETKTTQKDDVISDATDKIQEELLKKEIKNGISEEDFIDNNLKKDERWLFGSLRSWIPEFRGAVTKDKILKKLKKEKSKSGMLSFNKELLRYNSPEEVKDNLYYHGSGSMIGALKPSITMSEREVETFGGGGYGERYWGISLSKDRNIASTFTGQSRSGSVAPVLLRKDANVVEMKEIEDASEIEDYIEQLWKDEVDAVKIGDWKDEYSEQELVVLNPQAIVVGNSEYFQVFNKKKMPSFDDKKIREMYNNAPTEYKKLSEEASARHRENFISKYGREPFSSNRKRDAVMEYVNEKLKLRSLYRQIKDKIGNNNE